MKIKKQITIKINAEFGSEFQESVAEEMLSVFIKAWCHQIKSQHKENDLVIEIHGLKQEVF